MKHKQGKYIFSSLTITMTGNNLEKVLQSFIQQNYPVWDINKVSDTVSHLQIYEHHLHALTLLADDYDMEIVKGKVSGGTSFLKKLWKRKEWIIAFIISGIFIFLLTQTAWKVEIKGVSIHLEDKIKENLAELGLYQGAWTYNLASLDVIQDQVLHDMPELLYLGIEKQGVTYHIDALEKKSEKHLADSNSEQLIANKSGVVLKMFIKSGQPIVEINDVVKKGDILVKNEIETTEEEEKDKKKTNKVPVQGKVYANTWYNISLTTSLQLEQNQLTGNHIQKYQLQVKDTNIPLWGFWRSSYEQYVANEEVKALHLWKWNLPIQMIEQTIYEYNDQQVKRTLPETQEAVIKHVDNHIKTTLGQDTEILKYYVLHESVENGKVNMNIYLSVLENIAVEK